MPLLAEAHPLSARYAHSLGGEGKWGGGQRLAGPLDATKLPTLPGSRTPPSLGIFAPSLTHF